MKEYIFSVEYGAPNYKVEIYSVLSNCQKKARNSCWDTLPNEKQDRVEVIEQIDEREYTKPVFWHTPTSIQLTDTDWRV